MSKRLHDYLQEMSRPLPAAEREEWMAESAQHLAALVAAYEELGHSPDEATELALGKFGDAKQLGLQMRRASMRARPLPTSLQGVAALFLFQGAMCWYLTIPRFLTTGLINQALLIWGAPALFIGVGLLCRRRPWRTAALVSIGSTLAVTLPFTLGCPGWVRGVPLSLAGYRVLLYCAVPLWQYWVLTRREVHAVFTDEAPHPVAPAG